MLNSFGQTKMSTPFRALCLSKDYLTPFYYHFYFVCVRNTANSLRCMSRKFRLTTRLLHRNRTRFFEEALVQFKNSRVQLVIFQDERNIYLGSSLTHHFNLNSSVGKHSEDSCQNFRRSINICNEGGLVYGSCIVFRITLNDS